MALILILALGVALVVFQLTRRWKLSTRIFLSVAIFVISGVAPLAYVVLIGDQPADGTSVVTQEDLDNAARP
jgi:hypothetical protein